MDVSAWLLRHTAVRPLVVSVPGGTGARFSVERAVRERGWRVAASPGAANLLVIAGAVAEDLEPYVEEVWGLMPAPRARAEVGSPADTARRLDAAVAELRDVDRQRAAAVVQPAEPGEVPMADRAPDRDGLKLDRLHVPLGPVLPDWPAGLVVHTVLQGDVIQHAEATVAGLDGVREEIDHPPVARRLDACGTLLSMAGWDDAAANARRLRDDALLGAPAEQLAGPVTRWARRVRRSRTLRWSLRGVGTVPDEHATPPALRGDTLDRLHRWMDDTVRALEPSGEEPSVAGAPEAQWAVEALPGLLEGSELAHARLIVASLDLDVDVLARGEVRHG